MNATLKKNTLSSKACGVCLAPGDSVNHLDHLAVVAYFMQIPLVTDEESVYECIEKYYPQITPIFIREHQRILEYLAARYDTLFVSGAHYRRDLAPLFEIFFRKKVHFWYCPHGNSDKPMDQFKLQNYSLIYGNQMEERLGKMAILPQLDAYVHTSNYRFPFYLENEDFYDEHVENEIFSQFKTKQPTLLYAPTWEDMENSSSLFDVGFPIIDQLPDHYNLIVKLHPWLQHHQPGHVHLIREKYKDFPNIVVLSLFPLVLPVLKRTDMYLGDFSSIGYDFLYFNRPMFFFDPEKREKTRAEANSLHNCGTVIPKSAYHRIYDFIDENLHSQSSLKEARSKLYRYTFGDNRNFEELRKEVTDKLLAPEPTSDLL